MPVDLSQIFDQGQFSMVKPQMDAYNLEQQKQQATLAQLMGQEQRAQQMHPEEIASKQAYTRQANAQAGTMEDHLKVLQGIPMDQRIAAGVAENAGKLRGEALKQADTEMEQLSTLAAAAMQNGGTLPLGMNVSNPNHAKYFSSPKGAQLAAQIAKAYWMAKPAQLAATANDERDSKRAIELARIMAQSRVDSAGMRGGTKGSAADAGMPSKMSAEQSMSYWNNKAAQEKDRDLQAQYQAEADRYELLILRKAREVAAAGREGKPDLSQMGITTQAAPPLAATPRQGAASAPPPNPEASRLEFFRTNPKAIQIRNDMKAGKITKEEAAKQLLELK